MEKKFKLGIIGCGFMAKAIITGVVGSKIIAADSIIVSRKSKSFEEIKELGIITTFDNAYLAENSEYVLLAVKPQTLDEVLDEIKLTSPNKIISILAGVSKEKIKATFANAEVARCMPNTPCSILKGVTALDVSDFAERDREFIEEIFASLGEVVNVDESKMNAVTGISGSGPAYVYMFIKGLVDAGVNQGLNATDALDLAVNTVCGSAQMVINNPDKTLDQLINAVCSKGGTTIEAIKVFNRDNLNGIINDAVAACVKRANELGGEKKTDSRDENVLKNISKEIPDCIKNSDDVWIYTDGACSGNPGVGGWAAILMHGDKKKELSGGEEATTNNRMELMAVNSALKALKKPCTVKLFTDSTYVADAYNKAWINVWKINGWRTSGKTEVKNVDLWEDFLRLTALHKVEIIKIKGHSDDDFNNRCDRMAREECKKRQKPV